MNLCISFAERDEDQVKAKGKIAEHRPRKCILSTPASTRKKLLQPNKYTYIAQNLSQIGSPIESSEPLPDRTILGDWLRAA
jgi:hypothetical protein